MLVAAMPVLGAVQESSTTVQCNASWPREQSCGLRGGRKPLLDFKIAGGMRWARSGGLEVIEKTDKKDFQFPVTADGGRYVFATGRDENQFQGARLPARPNTVCLLKETR